MRRRPAGPAASPRPDPGTESTAPPVRAVRARRGRHASANQCQRVMPGRGAMTSMVLHRGPAGTPRGGRPAMKTARWNRGAARANRANPAALPRRREGSPGSVATTGPATATSTRRDRAGAAVSSPTNPALPLRATRPVRPMTRIRPRGPGGVRPLPTLKPTTTRSPGFATATQARTSITPTVRATGRFASCVRTERAGSPAAARTPSSHWRSSPIGLCCNRIRPDVREHR